MTEAEWLLCAEPKFMVRAPTTKWTDRQLRLFACACARQSHWFLLTAGASEVLEAAEQLADGTGSERRVQTFLHTLRSDLDDDHQFQQDLRNGKVWLGFSGGHPRMEVYNTFEWVFGPDQLGRTREGLKRPCADLLRDILGNPFRPVTFSPEWRTDTALSIAQQMYESREFSAMPILADALQDAGCDSEDVLNHCRGPGPHVRGCWVVDLLLGKE